MCHLLLVPLSSYIYWQTHCSATPTPCPWSGTVKHWSVFCYMIFAMWFFFYLVKQWYKINFKKIQICADMLISVWDVNSHPELPPSDVMLLHCLDLVCCWKWKWMAEEENVSLWEWFCSHTCSSCVCVCSQERRREFEANLEKAGLELETEDKIVRSSSTEQLRHLVDYMLWHIFFSE